MSTGAPSEQGPGRDPQTLAAGRVGRSHGLDGSFYVTRPKPRLLEQGTTLLLAGTERTVVRRAGTAERPILRLEGIDSRAAAEALRGQDLHVPAADVPTLQEGEWWAHELEGCRVLDGAVEVGTVSRLIEMPSCEVLEVERAGGAAPLLVPMVKDAIRLIDPAAGRVEIDLAFIGEEPQ